MTDLLKSAIIFTKSVKKFAQDVQVSQTGTVELFFGNEQNQKNFSDAIQKQDGDLAKFLLNWSSKSGKSSSFSLKINAEPGTGAAWVLNVEPPALKATVANLLDKEFKKMFNQSMGDRLKSAVTAAKNGGGSGQLDVGSLNIDM